VHSRGVRKLTHQPCDLMLIHWNQSQDMDTVDENGSSGEIRILNADSREQRDCVVYVS